MTNIHVTLACSDYDRTMPLVLGDVQPEGIDLTYLRLPVEEIFWRMLRHWEFDASEMSLSSYLIARSRADDLQAIPVFPSRCFRHFCIFIHTQAGIERPEDLAGKRVGVPEYQMTAALWQRAVLQHEYGVHPSTIAWLQGGLEQPRRQEKQAISVPAGIDIQPIAAQQTLSQMLAEGSIDALLTARTPSSFSGQTGTVRRLVPDYRAVERLYFSKTGIFPIMHVVVVRKEVLERHPWVAHSLYKAFARPKIGCSSK